MHTRAVGEELGTTSDAIAKTLAAEGIVLRDTQRDLPPGATLRRGELPRRALAAAPTQVDPIATLPHVTVSPAPDVDDTAALEATSPAEFQVKRLLGRGGMGQVHLATQRSLRRDVAIKSTAAEQASAASRMQLLHEASVTGGLEHPNIIPVHLLGRDDAGNPLMVMKKVEGVTWHALLADPEHPRWRKLLREGWDRTDVHLDVLRQVCCALEFAHDARVIHRDVKPENVMLGAFGEVYLLDWGVAARLDDAGVARDAGDVVGTPGFMSPEQVSTSAGPQGTWTDVYLLGATLHVVLTGRYRHEGDTMLACLHASLVSEPAVYPDTVPSDLAALCQRATRARADERPPGVAAFRAALEECVAHRGSMALCRAASASLTALRAALAPGEGRPTDREAAVRASAACRFGYAQALAAWPRNDDARRGLQACLDVLFEDELSRHGVEAAEALAAEMPDRSADHDARLDALRARLADDAARVATLRSVAYEMDASVSKTQRSQTFFAWGALVVAFNAVTLVRLSLGGAPTHRELVAMAAAGVAAAGVAAWRERASLLRNTYNRAVTTMLGGLVFAPLAHRLAAASAGVSTAWVVTVDQLVLCLMMGLGGAVLAPWMLGGAGVLGLGAAVSVAFPSAAYASFAVSTSAAVVVTVALGLREGVVSADPSP